MKFDLDQSTIQLTQGNLISLPDAEGSTVAVVWGKVWLTQDGDPRDYDLNPGESLTIRGDGLILISAFENSALTILQHCEDVAISSMKPGENASRAAVHGKVNDRDGVLYLSGDELQRYRRSAHQLRARYLASLFASLGSALSRGLTKLGDYAVALWLTNAGRRWNDPRNRWYLS
jgi:Protein of unknown function (DUF2917)